MVWDTALLCSVIANRGAGHEEALDRGGWMAKLSVEGGDPRDLLL